MKMENRVFLTLIWLFQKHGMRHEALETRKCFKSFAVRKLIPNDYVMCPMKQLLCLVKNYLSTYFYKRAQRVIKLQSKIKNVDNVVTTIKTHFTEQIMAEDNNIYFVLASNNQKKINPLIIGVFKNTAVLNDNGIIIQIDNNYHNYTHNMTSVVKLYSTT